MNRLAKKSLFAAALGSGLSLAAGAADLNPSQLGASCPAGFIGTYHFVNNQTGGAAAGQLAATWDSGDSCTTGPYSVLTNNQHFMCTAEGALTFAQTNLPGKLVLSDWTCSDQKTPPPPPPPCEKDCPPPPK
jgi:hypothetical protein